MAEPTTTQTPWRRYELVQVNACYTSDHEMQPDDDGEWVRYEQPAADCAALLAQRDALLAALKWDAEQVYAIFSSDIGGDLPARIAAVQEHVTAWRAAITLAESRA